jgi:hypothetical protein
VQFLKERQAEVLCLTQQTTRINLRKNLTELVKL